jgi:hypothetical protein
MDIKKFNSFLNEDVEGKKQKSIYKTVIEVVVISEEPLNESEFSLSEIEYMITDGDYSGQITIKSQDVLLGEDAVIAVKNQGSDPAFFQMDDKGFELEEESDDVNTQGEI